nr:MAG TPA: hypothetical protein [Caudoviricetes sp.]
MLDIDIFIAFLLSWVRVLNRKCSVYPTQEA